MKKVVYCLFSFVMLTGFTFKQPDSKNSDPEVKTCVGHCSYWCTQCLAIK